MIYWDHNSTSPLRRRVKERMLEAFELYGANPNSSHSLGQTSRAAIEKARRTLAAKFGCLPSEIVFTASATESNMSALWGLWFERTRDQPMRRKILLSPLEHSSVSENILFLKEKFGAEPEIMPLNERGLIDLEKIESLLSKNDYAFCSLAAAHNETGGLQPWTELAGLCKEKGVPFHSDLVQCVARLPFQLHTDGLTTATLAFHKVGGPKGVAALFIREKAKIEPIIRGGSQEKKRRAGTENIAAIVGAEALVEDCRELEKTFLAHTQAIRDQFENEIQSRLSDISIVAHSNPRLPNTSYIVFRRVKSDALLMSLDMKGICVSSGSACSSGVILASRALMNLGYSEQEALSAIRFSLGAESSFEEIPAVVEAVESSYSKLAA
jgi:cysteine desulfurase